MGSAWIVFFFLSSINEEKLSIESWRDMTVGLSDVLLLSLLIMQNPLSEPSDVSSEDISNWFKSVPVDRSLW